ncbi:MAG: type II secretion system F family protein [Planctomycetaceae bacterium]|jgi:type II secretory pathway component PulF|nr:type II secretion system F family protein [Planctomycetaceae bacterium]
MPEFEYVARTMTGDRVSGTTSAATQREAVGQLSGRQLFPLSVKVVRQKGSGLSLGGGINAQMMGVFYNQLSGLLRGGVPLLRSLNILREQTSSSKLKEVLEDIHRRVEDGEGLGDAFSRHPKVFSDIAINMTRAGGEGGFLDDALDRVGKFTEEQADLKSRTVGALAYPFMLATIGSAVIVVLLVFFVPMFGEMFDQLRSKGGMPWVTEALLGFSGFLRSYFFVGLAGFVALILGIRFYFASPSGRRVLDIIKLKIPVFGAINQSLAVARFCRVLGTLLANGVPIIKSLQISSQSAGNMILAEAISSATENIKSGESLAPPLSKSGSFPRTVTEMIAVAEESNSLDTVLVDIADSLEKRTSRKLDLAVKMIEPLLLVVMSGIILFVVVSLLLPIMNMRNAF